MSELKAAETLLPRLEPLNEPSLSSACSRQELIGTLDRLLEPGRFKDYGPNGLQVEGRPRVRKLVSGVTASQALIEAAIAAEADAILVHHGLFWRGHDGCVKGWLKKRLSLLLEHEINLLAYHLPLDAHPTLGNNAQLGDKLGLMTGGVIERFGDQDLGFLTEVSFEEAAALAAHARQTLGREVLLIDTAHRPIHRVAWCTGGAQGYFEAAIAAGADIFITGELSEPQAHYARECEVAYLACGHHATERYGVAAVGAHVAGLLGLEHQFIDIDNPA